VLESGNEFLTNAIAIAAQGSGGLVLKNDGTVIGFGFSPCFLNNQSHVPDGLSNVVSIAMEGTSSWAVKKDGSVAQWGREEDNEHFFDSLSDVKAVVFAGFGSWAYLVLKNDGTVLGLGGRQSTSARDPAKNPPIRSVMVGEQILSDVAALASRGNSPLVLRRDGTVIALDYPHPGGLFVQAPYEYIPAEPIMVDGTILSNVVAIAGGRGFALALKRDGMVVTMGDNTPPETAVPTGLSNVTAISVDDRMCLAQKRDGTVAAWGDSSSGKTSVPAGLSNVMAIAAGGGPRGLNLAITTGNIPSSVYSRPHGRLEEMAAASDLIFKGEVLSTTPITNEAFHITQMDVHETKLKVISVLKGKATTNIIGFQHYTKHPNIFWSGPHPPSYCQFDVGRTYLVFAANLDKPDKYYSPLPNIDSHPGEFRQIADFPKHDDDGIIRTLDARPLDGLNFKDAWWFELSLLLDDTNPTNALYAMDKLDRMSLAGRGDDQWARSDDFKRIAVLSSLLPFTTNNNEQVAGRAIICFGTDSNFAPELEPFADALVHVANNSPSLLCRLYAIKALSGTEGAAVSNSLARLLKDPDQNIRLSAVTFLPRFPLEFAEKALRERAEDDSPYVRSVVADIIGVGKYDRLLPTLTGLFAHSTGPVPFTQQKPLPAEALQPNPQSNGTGDVHGSAGRALLRFAPDQVADILKTNLNDPDFHVDFIAKLAEKDVEPWLPELVSILESRVKYVEDYSKSPPLDPRRFSDPQGGWILNGPYAICWEDIRHYLINLPKERLSNSATEHYMDFLESIIQSAAGMDHHEVYALYELYRTKGLEQRASGIRQKYPGHDSWFDDFDAHHPELKTKS
jgi:hypothetical protein